MKFLAVFAPILLAIGAMSGSTFSKQFSNNPLKLNEENVLLEENFDGELPEAYKNEFAVTDGAGLITRNNEVFNIPLKATESKNYQVDFNIKLAEGKSSDLSVHLVGLDAAGGDVILNIEGNGAYLNCRTNVSGGEIYNNSGDFYGGIDYNAVDLQKWAHFTFVEFDGFLELYVNGTRRFTAHLDAFGGTQYQGYNRIKIERGIVTALGLRASNGNAVLIDNLKVTEPKDTEGHIRAKNPNGDKYSILGSSAQETNSENFRLAVGFECVNIEKSAAYPTIKLMGMNGSLFGHNKESSLNFQFLDEKDKLSPYLYCQNNDGSDWIETKGKTNLINKVGKKFTYTIEVIGDSIKTYFDDTLALDTTFTTLNIPKGHMQYAMIRPQESGYKWISAEFDEFNKTSGAAISAVRSVYTLGDVVGVSAKLFGDRNQIYNWFVDGVDTTVTDLNYNTDTLTEGEHTFEFKNSTYTSNLLKINVTKGIITLSSEKLEGYTTDTYTINAAFEGNFDGFPTEWYLDGTKTEKAGETATFEGLTVGPHKVYVTAKGVKSNELTISVKTAAIKISSVKSAYNTTDTAVVTATPLGFAEGQQIAWFIDGTTVAGQTGLTLDVPMSNYTNGQQIIVKASIGEVISNDFVLTVYYDIANTLKSDESYEVLSEMKIEEGKTYGNYKVGNDADGNYLYADPSTIGPNCILETKLPTKNAYTYEYKLFVPETVDASYYVYPCLMGANSKYPNAALEVAFEVNKDGMRPYIKDQGSATNYDDDSGAVIADYTYETGVAKKNFWNHVEFAVHNKSVSVSLNGTAVLFFTLPSVTVPSALSMNWWSSLDGKNIPLKFKDVKIGGLKDPIPPLESISLSASSVEAKVGETVTFTASLNPFNAEAESYDWYVNGEIQSTKTATFAYTPTTAGDYEVYCKVGNITSNSKTVKFTADESGEEGPKDNKGLTIGLAVGGSVLGAIIIAAAIVLIVRKKRVK